MRFSYLVEDLNTDPIEGRLIALPMEGDGDAYVLDLCQGEASSGWTTWFVDAPRSAATVTETEAKLLAGEVGLPPGAEAA